MSAEMPKIAVAVVGVGLVGKEVVRQLFAPALDGVFEVVFLSGSTHAVALERGQRFDDAEALLALLPPSSTSPSNRPSLPSGATYSSTGFKSIVTALVTESTSSGQHTILVDCTSSADLGALYPQALSSGLSIVTPNKKGFASSSSLYTAIVSAQAEPGAGLCYHEATCGAGLPVLSTVRDLVATGDEILRVEGVLSGTLAYLFNQYSTVAGVEDGARPFSELVRVAKEHGHTEPHPADDLSGADVARKLTILARVASASSSTSSAPSSLPPLPELPEGHLSVPTQSLVSPELAALANPSEFLDKLANLDGDLAAQRDEAARAGRVLRYVGVIDRVRGEIRCGLESFPHSHPFASSTGSYLSLAIYTRRYASSPLVIQGQGYPLSVTAGAVVADAVRVAERYGARVGL
ncbi:uncharacterized protein RHOBADRAFT_41160 [Rhodotorula graminis WP1]|uniref:Homoserine dehydrogenase n=1 Tax=Rhodotorula graminis (strain WP1) TaxID=578459 RepID=A0A194SDS3_RHOGW|nr:uncharacterized protein RHOBADRAFT_41160 [Rhodotorula graminis WP1]KPV78615.1 hypothetical protein RHOBADRAFT_41160 [Rhodotorula graminis WP1]